MKINLHLLRIFMTVAELRSFSRAGEALHISQPAVSKGVRELEHQLDLPLVERGPGKPDKGVRLTENGVAVFAHARSIFAMERAATQDIQARVGLTRGSLAIGASTTVGAYWLPDYIGRFCRQFPGITPRLMVGNTQAVCEQLLACDVDLALIEGPVAHERIAVTPWREDPLALIAPPGTQMPAGGRDAVLPWLDAQRWILREPGSGTREVTRRIFASEGLAPADTLEVSSSEAIVRLVAAGTGISILPAVMAADLLALGRIAQLPYGPGQGASPQVLSRSLSLLQLRDRPDSPAAKGFLALIQAEANTSSSLSM